MKKKLKYIKIYNSIYSIPKNIVLILTIKFFFKNIPLVFHR